MESNQPPLTSPDNVVPKHIQLKMWYSHFITNSPESRNNIFRVDTIPQSH